MTIQQIKTAKNRESKAAGTKKSSAFQEHDGILQSWLAVSEEGIFVVQDGRIKECNRLPVAASKCIKTAGIKMYGFFEGQMKCRGAQGIPPGGLSAGGLIAWASCLSCGSFCPR
jgi:hypothetical protein